MKNWPRFVIVLVVLSAILVLLASAWLGWARPAVAAEAAPARGGLNSQTASLAFVAAALATAFATLGAGFAVAKVGAAAIGALAEKPELFGRLLIFVGLAEGIAIYGLIVSILILNRLG